MPWPPPLRFELGDLAGEGAGAFGSFFAADAAASSHAQSHAQSHSLGLVGSASGSAGVSVLVVDAEKQEASAKAVSTRPRKPQLSPSAS